MIVFANGRSYRWQWVDSIGHRLVAFVRIESMGKPLPSASIEVNHAELDVSNKGDGYYAIVTRRSALSFGAPQLIELHIRAPGHRDQRITLRIAEAPIDGGTVTLAPNPVRVRGRVSDVDDAPVASVTVELEAPTGSDHPVALHTPLAGDYPAGAPLASRGYSSTGGTVSLRAPARPGDDRIWVASSAGLTTGTVLRYGPPTRRSFWIVDSVAPAAVLVALSTPVVRETAGPVEVITAGAVTSTATLARPARAGDGVLWLDAPLADGPVELGSEVVELGLPLVDDRFQLDGVSSAVAFRAHATGLDHHPPVLVSNLSRNPIPIWLRMKRP